MALTQVQLQDLSTSLSNTITTTASAVVTLEAQIPPKIANVQVANSSWSALDDVAVDTAGGYVLINGSGFQSGCNVLLGNAPATSVTVANSSLLQVEVPAIVSGSYSVYVTNPDGGLAISLSGLTTSNTPVWSTSATLTPGQADVPITIDLGATEDGDTITYTVVGSLPTGLSLASNGQLTGTLSPVADTTYNFTVRATDEENQDADRTFSITITVPSAFIGSYAGGLGGWGINDNNELGMYFNLTTTPVSDGYIMSGMGATACGANYFQYSGLTLSKIDSAGALVWSEPYGSANNDISSGQQTLRIGGISPRDTYFARWANAQVSSFASTRWGIPKTHTVDNDGDVYFIRDDGYRSTNTATYVVKVNGSNGSIAWATQIKSSNTSLTNNSATATSISFDSTSNTVLVTGGLRQEDSRYQYGFASQFVTKIHTSNGLITNTNSWTQPEFYGMVILDAKVDSTGDNIIAAGSYYGQQFALGKANVASSNSGSQIWGYRYIDQNYDYHSFSRLVLDPSDDIYALGTADGVGSSAANTDYTVWVKANTTNGNIVWLNRIANTAANRKYVAGGMAIDSTGTYLYTTSTETSNNNATQARYGYVFKTRCSNGEIIWQRRLTSPGHGSQLFYVTDIQLDSSEDNMLISYAGGEDFRPSYTSTYMPAMSGGVLKLPVDGAGTSSNIGGLGFVYENTSIAVLTNNIFAGPSACNVLLPKSHHIAYDFIEWTPQSGNVVMYTDTSSAYPYRMRLSSLDASSTETFAGGYITANAYANVQNITI